MDKQFGKGGAMVLTPEQVAATRSSQWLGEGKEELLTPVAILCDSHEDLRADRDSWQATAEELEDRNVNKALLARHEMREARLREELAEVHDVAANLGNELAEAQAVVRELAEAAHDATMYFEGCGKRKPVKMALVKALALPAVQRAMEAGKTPSPPGCCQGAPGGGAR